MITRQTPDAVREAVDARVEIGAKALGLHRIPGGNGSLNPPTRWPTGPQDTLSGRDGTVPLTWGFAEQCRAEVRAILAALDSRAGDAGEESEALTGPQLDSVLDAINFVLAGEFDKNAFAHGEAVMERAYSKLSGLKGRTRRVSATPAPAPNSAGDAGEGAACPQCEGSGVGTVSDCCFVCDGEGKVAPTPAPAVDAPEPFGYWVEQKHADPMLLRKPAYIPEPSDFRTVTPLYASPAVDAVPAGEVERLREVLRSVRDDLHNENGLNLHSITDTVWHSEIETTVDFIDAALSHGEGRKNG